MFEKRKGMGKMTKHKIVSIICHNLQKCKLLFDFVLRPHHD